MNSASITSNAFCQPQGDKLLFKTQNFPIDFEMVDTLDNKNTHPPEISDGRGVRDEPTPIVLIVDDDDDSRLLLRTLLEMWKYRVIEAKEGREAINIAEIACPDLILMDIRMPNLDGFGVTQKIRQTAKIENVPIVFLSGCAEAIYNQKATDVGGNEYLVKPLDFRQFENTLGKYFCNSQQI